MDHIKVLKRAFQITWNYRALWIFGVILALTVGGGPSYNPNPGDSPQVEYTVDDPGEIPESFELPDGREVTVPQVLREVTTWIAIGVTLTGLCCCAIIIWIVVANVARYVAETALIRMVDDYEETGEKRGVREGFRMGWSRASFRLFLIDLLLFLAGLLLFALPIALLVAAGALAAFAMAELEAIVLGIIAIVAAVGLLFLIILLGILVGIAVQFLKPFFQRACVLEGLGVIDSIRHALGFVKRHFAWDIVIMWLIVLGLEIAWFFAMLIVGFMLVVAALVVAAAPLLLIGGLGSLIIGWPAWVVGGVLFLLVFLVLLIVPSVFLRGLEMTFLSTVWTLTYRELRALEGLAEEPQDSPENAPDSK
jgi:hypothetical protein